MENSVIKYNNRKTGKQYEEKAAEFLIKNGVKILDRNFALKGGEIDIIGRDENSIIFVEVKYRKNATHGQPFESVNIKKQKSICRIATMYIKIKKLPNNGSFRFDVISILDNEIKWYKNAFNYQI